LKDQRTNKQTSVLSSEVHFDQILPVSLYQVLSFFELTKLLPNVPNRSQSYFTRVFFLRSYRTIPFL